MPVPSGIRDAISPREHMTEDDSMFTAIIERQTSVMCQSDLNDLFHTDRVYLQANSELVVEGEIALGPEVSFSGSCLLTGPVRIESGSILTNVVLGPRTTVRAYSILSDLEAGAQNLFGPFCFIRDNCSVGDDCILGAHVEAARSRFASGVKISHRAFVGDANLGARTIIGAGVVFCNFDGRTRQATEVGAEVTVGSGTLLVPPLTIGNRALIAAGSVVTKDVAEDAKLIQKRPRRLERKTPTGSARAHRRLERGFRNE